VGLFAMTDYLEKQTTVDGGSFQIRIAGEGVPLLLLHGFTGSIEAMATLSGVLSHYFRVISVDLPGHGRTSLPENPTDYSFSKCNTGLIQILDQLHIDKCLICGYSMGGRVALLFTAQFPGRVSALATIGASGGIEVEEERVLRREKDDALACFIEFEGIEDFAERWMNNPLFAGQYRLGKTFLVETRRQRLANNPSWLAFSLRTMGTGSQTPVYRDLRQLDIPMLFIAGEEDKKFCDLAIKLKDSCPRGDTYFVKHAGHAAHLENRSATAEAIIDFFKNVFR
jgi:2-succinyl-6-hydroxy-2,4-cyclohexadiene-1-carboxylate synthase